MSYVLGLDIGYNGLKLSMGEAHLAPTLYHLPVGAAPADHMSTAIGNGIKDDSEEVYINGEKWVAGVDPGLLKGWE